ncbi:MAG TPA: flavodoxin family protein, partial [Armatimonadota bacterium]|nr:flavodoxin family protein [Armatimonadota bacterium]
MKILVVNGSPRGAHGNTEILVQDFLAGAHEAGAESEVIYLKNKKIEYCTGCLSCWLKTPGVCIHHDDMPAILEQIKTADVIVHASPLYFFTMPALMKAFTDRLIPTAQPFIEIKNGISTHPSRYATGPKSAVVISNSGFPEIAHFSGLKETYRRWYRGTSCTIDMICCAGGALLGVRELKDAFTWYRDAVRQAGREIAQDGRIGEATQAILDRPLVDDHVTYA